MSAASLLIVQKANSFLNQKVQLTMRCFKHVFIYLGHSTNRQKPMTEGIIVLCASDSVDYVFAHIYIQFHTGTVYKSIRQPSFDYSNNAANLSATDAGTCTITAMKVAIEPYPT